MNSTLKTALPIALVFLMVFGITFMSQFTANTPATTEREEEVPILPLIVGNAEIKHDSSPGAPAHNRFFPGNFEVGTDGSTNRVTFVVRNGRPASVFLTALPPSCSACTSARAAAIPHDALRQYFQTVAAGTLVSPFPAADLLSGIGWVKLQPRLAWHEFVFNDVTSKFELPGATETDGESWGLLQLGFKMASSGTPNPKNAWFDVYDAAGSKLSVQPYPFTVVVGGREPQEVNSSDINVLELSESNPSVQFESLCLSTTRTQLPMPTVSVGGDDSHVVLEKPIPLDATELAALSQSVSNQSQKSGSPADVQFLSGYRIRGTINRDAGGKSMDMGPFTREIFIGAGPGIVIPRPSRILIRGNVIGAIRLEGADKIDFGSYDGDYPQKKEIRIWTEKKDIELEVVNKFCSPEFLKPELSKPTPIAGRLYWKLTVQIPAKTGKSPPWDGYVYLRSVGENPISIRIQTSGHGR